MKRLLLIIPLILIYQQVVAITGLNVERVYYNEPIFAFTVRLLPFNAEDSCTGVIISEEFILTAAHCFAGANGKLNPNAIKIISLGIEGESYSRKGESLKLSVAENSAIVHPEYEKALKEDPEEWKNIHDIALIRFEGPLPEGKRPVSNIEPFVAEHKQVLDVAGYGWRGDFDTSLPYLRKAKVFAGEEPYSETQFRIDHTDGPNGPAGTCWGDSGGPALRFNEATGTYSLLGLNSFFNWKNPNSQTPCDDSHEAIYTEVSKYKDFIESAMKELKLKKKGI